MGSTQSISKTIQPIAVKLSQNVANIRLSFKPIIIKIVTWPLAAILEAILKT